MLTTKATVKATESATAELAPHTSAQGLPYFLPKRADLALGPLLRLETAMRGPQPPIYRTAQL